MSTELLNALPQRRELHFGDRVVKCFVERAADIYSGFRVAAERFPESLALRFDDCSWTYAQMDAEVVRLSTGLAKLGLCPGDRLAMLVRNRPEFVLLFYAAQRQGIVVVPMDVRLQGPEIAHVMLSSGATYLVHDEDMLDRVRAAQQELEIDTVIVPDSGAAVFPEVLVNAPALDAHRAREEDLAIILFTSGTSGKPKAAAITHLNVAHSVLHHSGNLGLDHTDRALVSVPLSHITGLLCGALAPLWVGATLIILKTFKARDFLAAAVACKMTYAIMVPAMYNLCLRVENYRDHDLSSWRLGHFGGAIMPEVTISALAEWLPNLQLVNGYGATECCSPAIMTPVGMGPVDYRSVGKPLACVDLLIIDPETCKEVPIGDSGELWIRGPMIISEYLNDPEASAAGLVGGYWRSGDIGSMDTDGNVFIHDRLKDLINRAGYKVYSAEVEAVLGRHPKVVEVAVVGRPDPVLGERVHAFISITGDISETELHEYCALNLSDYKVPESWTISAEILPRTSSGKLAKKTMRESLAV